MRENYQDRQENEDVVNGGLKLVYGVVAVVLLASAFLPVSCERDEPEMEERTQIIAQYQEDSIDQRGYRVN